MKIFNIFITITMLWVNIANAEYMLAESKSSSAKIYTETESWCSEDVVLNLKSLDDTKFEGDYEQLFPKVRALVVNICEKVKNIHFTNDGKYIENSSQSLTTGTWLSLSEDIVRSQHPEWFSSSSQVVSLDEFKQPVVVDVTEAKTSKEVVEATRIDTPKVIAKENSVEPSSNKQDASASFPQWIVSLLITLGLLAGMYFLLWSKGRSLLQQRGFVLGLMALSFIPSYVLPYYGSNSSIANAAYYLMRQDLLVTFWVHLFCYGVAILLMWQAQQGIKKSWVAAPILAAVFDLTPGLSSLPLIPTLLMAVSLFGIYLSGAKSDVVSKEISVDRVVNHEMPDNREVSTVIRSEQRSPIKDKEVIESNHVSTKPVGVLVISIINGLGGAIFAIMGMISFMAGVGVNDMGVLFLGIILNIFGTLFLALTYGLWMLTDWGYRYTKMVYIISIPLTVLSLITDFSATNFVSSIISIAICIWVILYLAKPNIRQLFSH